MVPQFQSHPMQEETTAAHSKLCHRRLAQRRPRRQWRRLRVKNVHMPFFSTMKSYDNEPIFKDDLGCDYYYF
jgi:hypothetical protein